MGTTVLGKKPTLEKHGDRPPLAASALDARAISGLSWVETDTAVVRFTAAVLAG